MRVRSVAAAALAGTAAIAGMNAGAAAAGPAIKAAKISTLRLRLGDQVHVAGSSISCVVQKSGTIVNFTCVLGSLSSPHAHSYAVGIADRATDLARVSAGGGSVKIVTVVAEPAISGSAFPSPSRRPKAFTVAPTTAILVGGTHVFCAVQSTSGTINVTCGLSSFEDKLEFPVGTYSVAESGKFALLAKVQRTHDFKPVSVRAQP
jgi:hypothetical protein